MEKTILPLELPKEFRNWLDFYHSLRKKCEREKVEMREDMIVSDDGYRYGKETPEHPYQERVTREISLSLIKSRALDEILQQLPKHEMMQRLRAQIFSPSDEVNEAIYSLLNITFEHR